MHYRYHSTKLQVFQEHLAPGRVLVLIQVGVAIKKKKQGHLNLARITPKACRIKAEPCISSATCCGMELRRSRVWNYRGLMYGIKLTGYMLMRDAMHVFDVSPCRHRVTDAIPSLLACIKNLNRINRFRFLLVTRTGRRRASAAIFRTQRLCRDVACGTNLQSKRTLARSVLLLW